MKLIVGPDPAAGAEAILTVPTNLIWRIISFEVILTTDATVATRVPHMILDDGAVTFLDIKTNADVTASETESFQWCSGIPDDISSNPALHGMPVDLILPAGFRVKTDTSSLQAGDNYAKPHLMVEEWIQD